MKRITLLLTALLFCTLTHAERIVKTPAFEAWNASTIEIRQITLSDTQTVLDVEANYMPGGWITYAPGTTLQADGKSYTIRSAKDFKIGEQNTIPESGTMTFQLIFPPLPQGTATVDLIEGENSGDFCIWGIRLDGKPVTSPLAGKKNPKETPTLIEPEFKNGIAVVTGEVVGYKPNMRMEGKVYVTNTLTADSEPTSFKVQDDGTFCVELPLMHATQASFSSYFLSGKVYVAPGEATHVQVNLPEVTRSRAKLRKDEPSLGERYYFTGTMAALNNEVTNAPEINAGISINSQEEYMQVMTDVSSLSLDAYKAYWIDRYNKGLKVLDQYPDLSDTYKQLLTQDARIAASQFLFMSSMLEMAYRMTNKIPRDSILPESTIPTPTRDYYSFVKEFLPNTPMALYSSKYANQLKQVQMIGISYGMGKKPDNISELKILMGTDKGILFDLLAVSGYASSIEGLTLLTEDQLADATRISPVIGEYMAGMNKQKQTFIESLTRPSAYTATQDNIATIPVEDTFNAISSKYRGKVVFVDLWATWCGPCLSAFKLTEPVKQELNRDDLVFVYLTGETSPLDTWQKKIPELDGEHFRVTNAQWDQIMKQFNTNGIPTYIILNRKGAPVFFHIGFMGVDKMKEVLQRELAL